MSSSICSLNKKTPHCLSKETINTLSESFSNKLNNNNPINTINELASKANCSKSLSTQEKELCILKKIQSENKNTDLEKTIKKHILISFKPLAKKLTEEYWLNNTEIDQIQYQFQKHFPGYYYSYIHMIDLKMFEPSNTDIILNSHKIENIKKINFINELKNNGQLTYNHKLQNYGIVCNTDTSDGRGKHWFSIFIDFKSNPITIEYFNSSGYPLNQTQDRTKFAEFFYNLADDLTKNGYPAEFIQVTKIEHQNSDTANCGSYSLFYIWKRLRGTPYTFFKNNKITDPMMEKFRSFLWRADTKKD